MLKKYKKSPDIIKVDDIIDKINRIKQSNTLDGQFSETTKLNLHLYIKLIYSSIKTISNKFKKNNPEIEWNDLERKCKEIVDMDVIENDNSDYWYLSKKLLEMESGFLVIGVQRVQKNTKLESGGYNKHSTSIGKSIRTVKKK